MGIFSRSSNTQTQTTNNYDQRQIFETNDSSDRSTENYDYSEVSTVSEANDYSDRSSRQESSVETNSEGYANNQGTIVFTSSTPEAWDFGDKALETIKAITADGYDQFTESIQRVNESTNSVLGGVALNAQSGGTGVIAETFGNIGKYIAYSAIALGIGMALKGAIK